MATAEAVAPRLDRFVVVPGNERAPEQWVAHLRFEGRTFRHTEFRIPPEGQPPRQAALGVDAVAVEVNAARDFQFDHCALEHLGATAFWFRRACRDCRVERTRMFDLGITGVRIGEQGLVPEPAQTGNITVHNCIIHSGGRIMPCAVGIWIGLSADNTITHCDVADFFYTAVSVGWRWGYDESGAKRNTIEWNHLHHIGYRILSDMGAVYTLGPSEGTSVRHNVIHDVLATRYGGWQAGAKVTLRDNLYWRAGGQPFDFIGKTFAQWQAEGHDAGSLIADPGFANPGERDFRLLPDSPAAKIGFVPFDFSRAGVYGDPRWIALVASTRYPKPYVVP